MARSFEHTPGVTLDAAGGRGGRGYYVDGNIARLHISEAGSFAEIDCDLKVLVATWPEKSILMWTEGGATVQTGFGEARIRSGLRDCLEAAVGPVRENLSAFLKAQ